VDEHIILSTVDLLINLQKPLKIKILN